MNNEIQSGPPITFNYRYGGLGLIIPLLMWVVFLGLSYMLVFLNGGSIGSVLGGVAMFIAGIVFIIYAISTFINCRVIIQGEKLTIVTAFGKRIYYHASQIVDVENRRIYDLQYGYRRVGVLQFSDGRRLQFGKNVSNFDELMEILSNIAPDSAKKVDDD